MIPRSNFYILILCTGGNREEKNIIRNFLALISVVILTSCGEKEKEAATTEAQANGGHMNIALYWVGETLDPALA